MAGLAGGEFRRYSLEPPVRSRPRERFLTNFRWVLADKHVSMGKRGPKPKPAELKILAGEREDRVNRSAPKPARSRPVFPAHLDAYGREAWEDLIPQLEQLGILTEADGHALALYCATYSRWRTARDEIAATGVTAYTGQGSIKGNPACTVAAQAERMLVQLLAEFGLTPSSRGRLSSAQGQSQDALAEFIARRKA